LQGGIEKISIKDNGVGIAKDDLALAIMRHTTSKIKTLNDLQGIKSYGFRGEALFTIASICNFTLRSFPKNQKNGYALTIHSANREPKITPVAIQHGTHILCEQLFAPVPVRRHFLKSPRLEAKRSENMFRNIFLIHPSIKARLLSNDQLVHNLKQHESNDIFGRIEEFFGKPRKEWLYIEHNIDMGRIHVWYHSIHTKGLEQYWYYEKRWVNDQHLNKLAQQYFPEGILIVQLCLDHEKIDVNAHPQKHTVSFAYIDSLLASLGDVFSSIKSEIPPHHLCSNQPSTTAVSKKELSTQTIINNTQHRAFNSSTPFNQKNLAKKHVLSDNNAGQTSHDIKSFASLPSGHILLWNQSHVVLFNGAAFIKEQIKSAPSRPLLLPLVIQHKEQQEYLTTLGICSYEKTLLSLPIMIDHLKFSILLTQSFLSKESFLQQFLALIDKQWLQTHSVEEIVAICSSCQIEHQILEWDIFLKLISSYDVK
jgi:DNA mismatch repair protein MutL